MQDCYSAAVWGLLRVHPPLLHPRTHLIQRRERQPPSQPINFQPPRDRSTNLQTGPKLGTNMFQMFSIIQPMFCWICRQSYNTICLPLPLACKNTWPKAAEGQSPEESAAFAWERTPKNLPAAGMVVSLVRFSKKARTSICYWIN